MDGASYTDIRWTPLLVYNHSATRRNRFPMVVVSGEDGYNFDQMFCLEGEVAPMRYWGLYKNIGSQYVRGIDEGNGQPPGSFLWNTWSMNKEDIWVCRTRVPVTGSPTGHLNEDFEALKSVQDLELWNIYSPRWAPIRLISERGKKCLALEDEEPWDYASVEVHFAASSRISVGFRAKVEPMGHGIPEMEIQSGSGVRCFRIRFQPEGLSLDLGRVEGNLTRCRVQEWHEVIVRLDRELQRGEIFLDGKPVRTDIRFGYPAVDLQRLVFRTGSWRGDVRHSFEEGEPGATGINQEDLPGADEKVPLTRFMISKVWTDPGGRMAEKAIPRDHRERS